MGFDHYHDDRGVWRADRLARWSEEARAERASWDGLETLWIHADRPPRLAAFEQVVLGLVAWRCARREVRAGGAANPWRTI